MPLPKAGASIDHVMHEGQAGDVVDFFSD